MVLSSFCKLLEDMQKPHEIALLAAPRVIDWYNETQGGNFPAVLMQVHKGDGVNDVKDIVKRADSEYRNQDGFRLGEFSSWLLIKIDSASSKLSKKSAVSRSLE